MVPIAEGQALSIGMLSNHRDLHFGLYADPGALPAAARLPDLLAEEVRVLGDTRPPPRARRPVVAVRVRTTPTP